MARWWERPQIWPDEETVGERKVGFLDLFYDLIFVVAIAQLAHGLAHHPDRKHLINFVMLFLPVFWTWIGHTFYADRFENRDISHTLYTFVAMLPVVGMAVFAHDGRSETAMGFIVSYVLGRMLLAWMWARAGVHNEEGRGVWFGLSGGFMVGALAWLASAFVDDPLRLQLQVGGLLWDLAVPSLLARDMAKLPRFAEGRLRERFGLIMIIVLGESVAGTANGLAGIEHYAWFHVATAVLAMTFAFGVYFTYFEMVPREHLKPGIPPSFIRTYLHFPLMLAVTATGAGVLATVGHEQEHLETGARLLVCLGVGIAYLCMIGLSRMHEYADFGAGRRGTEGSLWLAVAVAVSVAYMGKDWTSLQVLGALTLSAALPPITGMFYWRKLTRHLPKKPETPTGG